MARKRKQFLLRIPPELYDVYEGWAADEFRSVNAQMEAVLVDSARRAGRRPRPRPEPEAGEGPNGQAHQRQPT
ncbi:MAG: hypothetical protein GY720_11765 [bacterium]|nr:hypothetical protein [bacterium]